MKKYVSRKRTRIAIILLVLFTISAFFICITRSSIMFLISMIFFVPAAVLMIRTNRCPYCGEEFRGLYWDKSNAGYCRKCGQLIEFDDRDKED